MTYQYTVGDEVAFYNNRGRFQSWKKVHKVYKNGNVVLQFTGHNGSFYTRQFSAKHNYDGVFHETGDSYYGGFIRPRTPENEERVAREQKAQAEKELRQRVRKAASEANWSNMDLETIVKIADLLGVEV